MSGSARWTVRERGNDRTGKPAVFHLPVNQDSNDPDWFPVRCGGGIVLSGGLERVPLTEVCKDCRAGRVTL